MYCTRAGDTIHPALRKRRVWPARLLQSHVAIICWRTRTQKPMAVRMMTDSTVVLVHPIYAEFGDCIIIEVKEKGNSKHYLIDGGPTKSYGGSPPKIYQYLFRYLTTRCLQPSSQSDFSLAGVVVTHPDGDHIDGIIKLFETFPPNTGASFGSYKFVFNGPVLITEYFKKVCSGSELIQLLTSSTNLTPFKEESISVNPAQVSDFGERLKFYFQKESDGQGLILKYRPPVEHMVMQLVALRMLAKTRHTIDDSRANLSSIITTWNDKGKQVVVLTGDAPGYRVLDALKGNAQNGEIPDVGFFQIPHHGSARNSLPLDKNVLPSTEDGVIVHHMILFQIILGYALKDEPGSLSPQDKQDLLNQWVGTSLMSKLQKLNFSVIMADFFGPALVNAVNDNKNIVSPNSSQSKAMYVYTQAVAGLQAVSKQVEDYIKDPSSHDIESVFSTNFNGLFILKGKYLYNSSARKALDSLRTLPDIRNFSFAVEGKLLRVDNPYLDQIMSTRVSQMYEQFHADIYYISSSTKHGHPSSATLSGVIKAANLKNRACTLLLSSGYALPIRSLPDYTTWKDRVTIRYFTQPHAQVNPQSKEMASTEVFNPSAYDKSKLDQLKQDLKSGAASKYFSKNLASDSGFRPTATLYKVTTVKDGKTYYLSLVKDEAVTIFVSTETKSLLKALLQNDNRGTLCNYSYEALQRQAFVEPSLHNKNLFILYELDTKDDKLGKKYWKLPSSGVGSLQLSLNLSEAAAFQFQLGLKRKRSEISLKFQHPSQSWLGIKGDSLSKFNLLPMSASPLNLGIRSIPISTVDSMARMLTTDSAKVSLQQYLEIVGVDCPADGITVEQLFDVLLNSKITEQLKRLLEPPAVAEVVTDILPLKVDESSSFTTSSDQEEILSASIKVNLSNRCITLLNAPIEGVFFSVSSPRTESLSLNMVITWSFQGSEASFPLSKQLDLTIEGEILSEFLKRIKFAEDVKDVSFGDMAVLFTGSYFKGLTSVTSLPLTLIQAVAPWKVDNFKSEVKSIQFTSGPYITDFVISASIPTSSESVTFQDFSITLEELLLMYSSPNKTYKLSGKGLLRYQKSSPLQVNFFTEPCNDDSTPEITFQYDVQVTSLSDFLSFLKLDSRLEDIIIPFLSSALKALSLSTMGFSLKQGIRDSSDTYYINALSFTVSLSTWNSWMPKGILSVDENVNCTVSIFQPHSAQPRVGFDSEFSILVGSEGFKLPCKASILPLQASMKGETSGYICFLELSTSIYNELGQIIGLPQLASIMSAIGFGAQFQELTKSIPVIGSFLQHISLKRFQITYNTATKAVSSFYFQVVVPQWNLYKQISLSNFELELQYSETGGWEANLQSDVVLSEAYYITISFSLPTSSEPGGLSFHNQYEDLTTATLVGLVGLPSLEEIPVLGSILDITVKEVELGFETDGRALSLYGMKLEFYMKNIDMQVFQLTNINIVLAYNKSDDGAEISYRASGFVNETIFVEVAYDPSKSEFKGHFEVTNNRVLSVDDAVKSLLGNTSLSQNTAYNAVATKSSASVLMSLAYNRVSKDVSLQTFCISLENMFDMKFSSLSLSHFSLEYTMDSNQSSSGLSPQILPSGSKLHLNAILLQRDGDFGLQLSFDCTTSDDGSNSMTAMIQSIPGKQLSLRSFLSLAGVASPQLPESSSESKPSPDGYLDLEVESGTITFKTKPITVLKSFKITTAFATKGWIILDDPRIELSDIRLTVSYDDENGVEATLYGTFMVGSLQIILGGKKANDTSVFQMVISKGVNFDDFMQIANDLSPSDKQGIFIPPDAGLPKSLDGSFSVLKLLFTPKSQTLDLQVSLNLGSWVFDLHFTTFTAKQLVANLHWEKSHKNSTESARDRTSNSPTVTYTLNLSGHLSFDSIPVIAELNIGSTSDTIVVVKVNDPSALHLSSIVDKALGFASEEHDLPLHFSDLLPHNTSPIVFLSGYLQFNLTKKMFLLLGNVKDMGTCLLIAGSLKDAADVGYAVTLTLPKLSSLLGPLEPVESAISLRNVNASLLNLANLDIADLTSVVKLAESNLAYSDGQPPKSLLPFKNLLIPPDSATAKVEIEKGMAFYCELIFSESLSRSQLINNLVVIQPEDDRLPSVIIFAQFSGNKAVMQSTFIAKIPSIRLLGSLEFQDTNFEFSCNASGDTTTYTLSLSGYMMVPLVSSARFHGDLRVLENKTTFKLAGNDKPTSIAAPLGMFGVNFMQPSLEVTYDYSDETKINSEFALRGGVDFFSSPEGSSDHSPSLTLTGVCIWVDSSPSIISIDLQTENNPLTLTDLVATIFGQAWDTNFLDIGLYDGKMYYSKKDVTVAEYDYKSGYHITCKTFIFSRSFVVQVDVSIPKDQTGFSISGSGVQPFDLGFAQLSTEQTDDDRNFKNLGPTLTYTHSRTYTKLSLGVGLTFLDVKIAAITIDYEPSPKAFIFTVTYPEKFLGTKPSISCVWSEENGFQITSWSLGSPDIPGFDGELKREIQKFANKPTAKGCAAIANFVFRQAVQTKFVIGMHTAHKAMWNSDDLVAFQLTGSYSISLGGAVKIVSVPLPDIIVHVPNPGNKTRTMADVANYVLHTLVTNAGSIAEQILSNPKYLAEVFAALAFDQLVKQGSQYVINSLICRGLTEDQVNDIGSEAAEGETSSAESAGEEVASAEEAFAGAGTLAEAVTAADGFIDALGILSGVLGSLLGVLSFFGLTSKAYRDKKKQYDKAWDELKSKMAKLLTLKSPLSYVIQEDQLTLSWPPLHDPPSNLEYLITLNIISPVIDHIPPITSRVTKSEAKIKDQHVLLASSITVDIIASIKLKDHVFESITPLSVTVTHQATLPAPSSVVVHHNISDYSLVGVVTGIPTEAQGVKADVIGVDANGIDHCLSSIRNDRSSDSIAFTFSNSDYATFVGSGFKIRAQSLRSGLQSSRFTVSKMIVQLTPPSDIQYSLPAFEDSDPLIRIKWILPSDTSNVYGVLIQILDNSHRVILNKIMQKTDSHLPTDGTFSLAEFRKNVSDGVQYTVRSSCTSNSTSIVNSGYSSSGNAFHVANPPSDVSASFVKETEKFIIAWTPVDDTSKYAMQMLTKESHVSIFSHVVDIQKKKQGSYSLSLSDISKMTPGERFTVQVFSVGNSESLLSSFSATMFCKAALYMERIKNSSISYNVEGDSVEVRFDSMKQADGYTLSVLQYHESTSTVATADIISQFTIPPEETEMQVNYLLALTEFRDKLSDHDTCGFEVRAFGSASDIPSPYVKLDKTWKITEQPSNITSIYSASTDQLTLTCHPISGFMLYNLIVMNEMSDETFLKCSSAELPTAKWSGSGLTGSGQDQYICIAQTVGTADLFSSKLAKSLTKLIRLDPLSTQPTVDYTSDASSITLSYPFIQNAQSYYFKLDSFQQKEKPQTLHVIDDFKPSLSDKQVVIHFQLSDASISPGTSLVVTSHAKGGGNYINSNESQFSSGAIQSLDHVANVKAVYDYKNQILSIKWNEDSSSSFYSIDCYNSETRESLYTKSEIKSANVQVQASEFTQHGAITVSLSVTAHSGGGPKPYLPSTSKCQEFNVDKLIEYLHVRRVNVANAIVEWIVPNKWKSQAKDIEILLVIETTTGKKREINSTGELQSFYVADLTNEHNYVVSLIPGLSSSPTVIGIPLHSCIPGASLSNFNTFSSKHGSGVSIRGVIPVIVSSTERDNAVAYTRLPVPVGYMYELTVIKSGVIRFGVTTSPPDTAPLFKWLTNAIYRCDFWVWFHDNVWNGGKPVRVQFNIEESHGSNLKVGQTLGMAVFSNGELHVYVDGKDVGTPWKNLPTDKPLYGVVGLENFGENSTFELKPMSPAPNQFSPHHGAGIELDDDFSVVSAIATDNAVAYTSLPVPLGRLYQLKVLHPGIIRFGLTLSHPDTAALFKWLTNAIYNSDYWVWFHNNVWNDGKFKEVQFNIEGSRGSNLKVGQTLGMAVFPNGELHVYVDGRDVGTPWKNLPTDKPLYGVVGLENYDVQSRGSFKLDLMSLAPNQFSPHHGAGIELDDDFHVVSAIATDNAVAYTSLPVPLGRLYQLKVLHPGIIRFGLTLSLPDTAPLFKWLTNAIYNSDYWVWFHNNVWNDGKLKEVQFNIEGSRGSNLKVGQTLGMAVFPNGELHVYVDGRDVGTPWKNLPTDKPLYGVVGLENYDVQSRGKFKLEAEEIVTEL